MRKKAKAVDAEVASARALLLEGVGAEVAASFPGITRVGGQIVAALWLEGRPLSMDALAAELGVAKSNVFTNLRALEGASIVEKHRPVGARHDLYALRGAYPDVIVGAYLGRVRRVIEDKRVLARRALAVLGDARGPEADALREKVEALGRKYDRFSETFDALVPVAGMPIDVEGLLDRIPLGVVKTLGDLARKAFGTFAAPKKD
jgi:DNA-binding transcriptional regulator GbsR (MarR family)